MTTNLSGSLSEFSLAEVLSLLGMGGRTARMQVTSPGAVGTVHLVDGRISSATADSARAGLLRGLVAALPVPADDLAVALQSEDPVRALVESGVVDRDAAQQVAAENCTEAVGEMLDWASGEFAVWVGSQDPSDIGVRLDVDDRGQRRAGAGPGVARPARCPARLRQRPGPCAERGPRPGRRHRGLGRAGPRGWAADPGGGPRCHGRLAVGRRAIASSS